MPIKRLLTAMEEQGKKDRFASLSTMSYILKKVAHPTRLAVIYLLEKKGELSVNTMIDILNCEQSLLSHHLSELREIGLLKTERRGQQIFYSVTDKNFSKMLHSFDTSELVESSGSKAPKGRKSHILLMMTSRTNVPVMGRNYITNN